MKAKKKSAVRYLGRVTKDLYRIMPFEISMVIFMKLLRSIVSFLQISVTALFFDAAGRWLEGSADSRELAGKAAVFAAVQCLPLLFDLVEEGLQSIPMFIKHHALIEKLHARAVSLPAILLEDSEFYNEVWRAKMCIYNHGLLQYFFGFIDLVPLLFGFAGTVWVIATFHIYYIPLALVSIVPSLIARLLCQKEQYSMRRRQTPLERRMEYLWDVLTEKSTVKELRTMETEGYVRKRWEEAKDAVMEETFRFEMKNASRFLLGDLFRLFGVAASIFLSIWFAGIGLISVGQFAACIAAFGGLQSMAEGVVNLFAWQKGRADFAGDYYDFFDREPEKEESGKFRGLRNRIELKDVSFCYSEGAEEALSGVSLYIGKGERVVIVGENGSGKTTLSKIIAGIYRPCEGRVLYDGRDADSFEKDSFYRRFSIIQQNFVKYQFPMRENIGISMPSQVHNDERLMKSAGEAGIGRLVERIGGLDTQLGREFGGVDLSGGEWQKVAIARGLNKDADIIVLDEPTSALDPLVEYDILERFLDITKGKTSVIISHRIGLCRFADRIIVMKNGKIIQTGTHSELLAAGGEYGRMWHEQARWYE